MIVLFQCLQCTSIITIISKLVFLWLLYRYSIFGLGSSEYPHFCAFADKADKAMDKLGCHRLLPLATGDAGKNQEADFRCVSIQYTDC